MGCRLYEELLSTLYSPSLSNHRLFLKLCMVFKIIHNLCLFPSGVFSTRESRLYINRPLLTQPYARTNSYLYLFVPNHVSHWNCLPSAVLTPCSFREFKCRLRHHLYVLVSFRNTLISVWVHNWLAYAIFCTHASAKVS